VDTVYHNYTDSFYADLGHGGTSGSGRQKNFEFPSVQTHTHMQAAFMKQLLMTFGRRRTIVRKQSGGVFTVTAGASSQPQDCGALSVPGSEQGYETLLRKIHVRSQSCLMSKVDRGSAHADWPGGKSAKGLHFDSK